MLVYNISLNTLETGILCELTVSPRPNKATCFSAANPTPPPPPPLLLGPVMPRRNKPF